MSVRELPGWATRPEKPWERLVQCGACGQTVRFDEMAAHLRDACPGARPARGDGKDEAA
jgi:hypothetical protein